METHLAMTFDNFEPNKQNKVALGNALFVVEGVHQEVEPPIVLHGPTLSGKTHLLQAVYAAANAKGYNVHYVDLAVDQIGGIHLWAQPGGRLIVLLDNIDMCRGSSYRFWHLADLITQITEAGHMVMAAGRYSLTELHHQQSPRTDIPWKMHEVRIGY